MSYFLQQLIIPIFPFQSTKGTSQNRLTQFRIVCCSTESNLPEGEEKRAESDSRVILVERYSDGAVKRYIQGEGLFLRTVLEEHVSSNENFPGSHVSGLSLSWLPSAVKDFFLPAGFPGSVSEDYLLYMLLQFPTNVTAWVCHTLVTSSLLKAVGISSFSGTSAAASAAAIRWVSKDGIGAVGRLFIGGRFGNLFDDDPKQWRMYADFIGSAGSILDLSTQVYPAYFLQLASIGNLAKAVARGLKDPSFRVIQNHFAISGNLGEVAAKDQSSGKTIGSARMKDGLYYFEDNLSRSKTVQGFSSVSSVSIYEQIMVWHYRLGHPSFTYLKHLFPSLFKNINLKSLQCESCFLAKSHRSTYVPTPYQPSRPFYLFHSDVWGPSKVTTIRERGPTGKQVHLLFQQMTNRTLRMKIKKIIQEEVWEVAAQLLGLALGVLILDSAVVKHYPTLVSTWASIRLVHLWLRYQSLSVLQFNTINLKRARMLVQSHVLTSIVPGCVDCNREENILLWQRFMKPRITFGVPLDEMIGGERSVSRLKMLLRIYRKEKYILLVKHRQDFEVDISFKVGATSVTVLQSLWQTYWLHENYSNVSDDILNKVEQSLLEMNDKFEGFFQQLGEAGWETSQINLKVPMGVSIDEHPI